MIVRSPAWIVAAAIVLAHVTGVANTVGGVIANIGGAIVAVDNSIPAVIDLKKRIAPKPQPKMPVKAKPKP